MTVGGDRASIVAALGTVPGLAPSPAMPGPIVAGSAWPSWFRSNVRGGCIHVNLWYVYVAVPNGTTSATVAAADDLLELVVDALTPLGHLDPVEAWRIPVEPGQQAIPVQRYTLET